MRQSYTPTLHMQGLIIIFAERFGLGLTIETDYTSKQNVYVLQIEPGFISYSINIGLKFNLTDL